MSESLDVHGCMFVSVSVSGTVSVLRICALLCIEYTMLQCSFFFLTFISGN